MSPFSEKLKASQKRFENNNKYENVSIPLLQRDKVGDFTELKKVLPDLSLEEKEKFLENAIKTRFGLELEDIFIRPFPNKWIGIEEKKIKYFFLLTIFLYLNGSSFPSIFESDFLLEDFQDIELSSIRNISAYLSTITTHIHYASSEIRTINFLKFPPNEKNKNRIKEIEKYFGLNIFEILDLNIKNDGRVKFFPKRRSNDFSVFQVENYIYVLYLLTCKGRKVNEVLSIVNSSYTSKLSSTLISSANYRILSEKAKIIFKAKFKQRRKNGM